MDKYKKTREDITKEIEKSVKKILKLNTIDAKIESNKILEYQLYLKYIKLLEIQKQIFDVILNEQEEEKNDNK